MSRFETRLTWTNSSSRPANLGGLPGSAATTFGKLVGWAEAVAAVGISGLHFHDLRHTGNGLASKVPGTTIRDLMSRMGHDSPRAAMIYLHGYSGADRATADGMPLASPWHDRGTRASRG
jgi:integrase